MNKIFKTEQESSDYYDNFYPQMRPAIIVGTLELYGATRNE